MTTIFTLLKKDHQNVKELLQEILSTSERAIASRQKLFAKLKSELQQHEDIEESVVYPVFKEIEQLKPLVLEAYEEHALVDDLLATIEATSAEEESWKAKITVLKENLMHHIKEEEEQIFPLAKQYVDTEILDEMAAEMQSIQQEQE